MTLLRLLLIEDSADDAFLTVRVLRRAGYDVQAHRVQDAEGMARAIGERTWDAVISDHSMPSFDALAALRLLRESGSDAPFLIVSGHIGEETAVEAMAAGASDYVMKDNLARLPPALERELAEARERRERRQAQAEARKLAAIVECSFDAIFAQDLGGRVTSWNPAAEGTFGYSAALMLGERADRLVPSRRRDERRELVDRVLRGERVEQHETERLTKDGRAISVSLTMSPIRADDGTIVGISTIARDISDRKRIEAQLQYLADHDALTGLYNRRRFAEELERVIAYAGRYGEAAALLVLDLDNFKYFNDTYGHRTGDQLLRAITATLRRRVRGTDVVGRLGGDEFAVLLPRADAAQAHALAGELLEAVREIRLPLSAGGSRVTASIGVAALDAHSSADEVLAQADLAMYGIKDSGRDAVALYSPDGHRRLAARHGWEERIRRALADERFDLHFQPIVDVASGRVEQGELLLRMRDEDGKFVAPTAFLGIAERSPLITEIDRWVVRRAIDMLARLPESAVAPRVEVNLSGRSIDDAALHEVIGEELARTGIDPGRLVFEITETAAVANIDDAARFAEQLNRAGCGFALDDFGTGFGSFYYLKHLPIDYVKIDGDFIRDLPSAPTDQLMVQAIVQVSKGLGMKTIAEWVTSDETLQLLRAYGIDYAQGYHVGRPRPVAGAAPALPRR